MKEKIAMVKRPGIISRMGLCHSAFAVPKIGPAAGTQIEQAIEEAQLAIQ